MQLSKYNLCIIDEVQEGDGSRVNTLIRCSVHRESETQRHPVRPVKRRRENVFESAMKAQQTLLKGFLSQPTLQSPPKPWMQLQLHYNPVPGFS